MRFCKQCSNMYYIRLAEEGRGLCYYCRNCGHEEEATERIIVSSTQLKKSEQQFNHIINQYTKLDPTLPRMTNILCPNMECSTNQRLRGVEESKEESKEEVKREIIYIRYDDVNLKYVYLCCDCDHVWKTADKT
jgi:DNA-directed RNA polymerase subunit M/transcription elongation factor TFIIS